MVDKLYHRANPRSSFRLAVHFVVVTALCLRSRHTLIIENLRSKGIAMCAYGVCAYYA